jgi:alkylhydroperoxidase/carboxymuconolactone decarboxylase family protein
MLMQYYNPNDLQRFAEIAKFQPELMKKFFEYYNKVTDEDGALTRREKALIALAIAHAKPCPYCIDAYTKRCLELGATPEQMTEAVHVAASLQAGVALIHGIQMHNAMVRDIG